jgi:hypothetical protein
MTQDEIMAMWNTIIKYAPSEMRITEFANLVAAKATQKEQDRCCAIVFGQCESDNVAQRTVNAIRGKA